MSAEMFSALVTARLRAQPDFEIQGGKDLALQVRVRGQDTTAQLERAYERYRAAPAALTPVIDELIETLRRGAQSEPRGTAEFARVAPQLLPQFMTALQWRAKRDEGLRLVIHPLVQDLGIALVMDRDREIEYVQIKALAAWDVDAPHAYAIAQQNLERAATVETVSHGQGRETLLMDSYADGYAAARALLPARVREWQARVQGELVLAMPTRDVLLGFGRAHPALADLRAQVRHDAQTHARGLFPHLLLARDNTLEILA